MFAKLYLRTKVFRISGRCGHPGDTTRSENFRFDRFSLSRRYFPIQPRGDAPSRLLDLARLGTMSRLLTAADPRSRPSPALLRCRASESEVSGALRDGAKDLARRNFLSTPFQMLPDLKFREQPGGQI